MFYDKQDDCFYFTVMIATYLGLPKDKAKILK